MHYKRCPPLLAVAAILGAGLVPAATASAVRGDQPRGQAARVHLHATRCTHGRGRAFRRGTSRRRTSSCAPRLRSVTAPGAGSAAQALPVPPSTTASDEAITCSGTDQIPTRANLASVEWATICLVNRARAEAGLPALIPEAHLQAAAFHHSVDMVMSRYFDHTSPTGETSAERIFMSRYVPPGASYSIGENLAVGTLGLSTPRQIVASWLRSPAHRANILDPSYQDTGLAVVPAVPSPPFPDQPGGTYTQEFGALG